VSHLARYSQHDIVLAETAFVGADRPRTDLGNRYQRGEARVERRTLMLLVRGTLTLRR